MNNDRIVWFGRYEGWLRYLAHGVKDGDEECILKAARLFDLMLPERCVIVPMPSHEGKATTMLRVARAARLGRAVCDILKCAPHESSYAQKKAGMLPSQFKMSRKGPIRATPEQMRGGVWIIDNVVCTGVTAGEALRAMSRGIANANVRVCVLAASMWR